MAKRSPFQSDLEQHLGLQPTSKPVEILRNGGSTKPNSSTSSRASFEASINALVNEQLARLAEV